MQQVGHAGHVVGHGSAARDGDGLALVQSVHEGGRDLQSLQQPGRRQSQHGQGATRRQLPWQQQHFGMAELVA